MKLQRIRGIKNLFQELWGFKLRRKEEKEKSSWREKWREQAIVVKSGEIRSLEVGNNGKQVLLKYREQNIKEWKWASLIKAWYK